MPKKEQTQIRNPDTDLGAAKPRIPSKVPGMRVRIPTFNTPASRWRAGHRILGRLANQALGKYRDDPEECFTEEEMQAACVVLPYLVARVKDAPGEGDDNTLRINITHQIEGDPETS